MESSSSRGILLRLRKFRWDCENFAILAKLRNFAGPKNFAKLAKFR